MPAHFVEAEYNLGLDGFDSYLITSNAPSNYPICEWRAKWLRRIPNAIQFNVASSICWLITHLLENAFFVCQRFSVERAHKVGERHRYDWLRTFHGSLGLDKIDNNNAYNISKRDDINIIHGCGPDTHVGRAHDASENNINSEFHRNALDFPCGNSIMCCSVFRSLCSAAAAVVSCDGAHSSHLGDSVSDALTAHTYNLFSVDASQSRFRLICCATWIHSSAITLFSLRTQFLQSDSFIISLPWIVLFPCNQSLRPHHENMIGEL